MKRGRLLEIVNRLYNDSCNLAKYEEIEQKCNDYDDLLQFITNHFVVPNEERKVMNSIKDIVENKLDNLNKYIADMESQLPRVAQTEIELRMMKSTKKEWGKIYYLLKELGWLDE